MQPTITTTVDTVTAGAYRASLVQIQYADRTEYQVFWQVGLAEIKRSERYQDTDAIAALWTLARIDVLSNWQIVAPKAPRRLGRIAAVASACLASVGAALAATPLATVATVAAALGGV